MIGLSLIPLNIELQQDDRTVCCGHKIVQGNHQVNNQVNHQVNHQFNQVKIVIVLVLLSASVERFNVSRMRDLKIKKINKL